MAPPIEVPPENSSRGAFSIASANARTESSSFSRVQGTATTCNCGPVHCVMGTWGAEFHPDLNAVGPVVRKGSHGEDGYSGFSMRHPETGETMPTGLAEMLGEAGVTQLVIAGLATDYCVKSTVLDAREKGYPITVIQNGIRAVDLNEGDGDRAVEEMLGAGALLESRATVSAAPAPDRG